MYDVQTILKTIKPVSNGLFGFLGSKKARIINSLLEDIRKYEYLIELETFASSQMDSLIDVANKNIPKRKIKKELKKSLLFEYEKLSEQNNFFKDNIERYNQRIKLRKELIQAITKGEI
jgi:hypothetical protein